MSSFSLQLTFAWIVFSWALAVVAAILYIEKNAKNEVEKLAWKQPLFPLFPILGLIGIGIVFYTEHSWEHL